MRIKKIITVMILYSLNLLAEGKHVIFVLDASGSMYGLPLYQAKDAMIKTAKAIFAKGDKIQLIIPEDREEICNEKLRLKTEFFSDIKAFEPIISSITTGSYNAIPIGFEHAQNEMLKNSYTGHIYMFGDCDGLELCNTGIKAIATKYTQLKHLTPFTYMQLNGCNGAEISSWNSTFNTIGNNKAQIFNYEAISNGQSKKIKPHIRYFLHPKFINEDGSNNSGGSYINRPWRCVQSDGLFWLTMTKKEQKLNFYIQKGSVSDKNNILVDSYIKKLNKKSSCGQESWRLPDNFELSRLTQIGTEQRKRLFPYIKNWAYITASGGAYDGFKKGIDLNNGQSYDYRENRPYSAIFVSGGIDTSLFTLPSNYVKNTQTIRIPPLPILIQEKNTTKIKIKKIIKDSNTSINKPKISTVRESIAKTIEEENPPSKMEKSNTLQPNVLPLPTPLKKERKSTGNFWKDTGMPETEK
jgi:hypothetical protein